MAVGVQQQQRRDTEANWVTSGKVLAAGEIGYATDSHIIKLGDGVNTWDDLTIPYDGRYLPIGGKAADSDLIDGVSLGGLLLVGDATTTATADKVVKRDSSGRGKIVAGAASGDIVEYDQMLAAHVVTKQNLISRTVTAAFTLALTDVGKTILVSNSSYTTFAANIPLNTSVAFPVGSTIKILASDKGPATLTPAGGVTLSGPTALPGGFSHVTLVKTGTDAWLVADIHYGNIPILRRKIKSGTDNNVVDATWTRLRLDGVDTAGSPSNSADTLGTNEQYNSAVNLYQANVRRAGWYDVRGQVTFDLGISGRGYIDLRVNGNSTGFGRGHAYGNAAEAGVNHSTHMPLNVGDYLEVWVWQNAAATRTVNESPYGSCVFEWAWRRPL